MIPKDKKLPPKRQLLFTIHSLLLLLLLLLLAVLAVSIPASAAMLEAPAPARVREAMVGLGNFSAPFPGAQEAELEAAAAACGASPVRRLFTITLPLLRPAEIDALIEKQEKNKLRSWPDWQTAEPDKAIEHVRLAQSSGDRK